MESASSLDLLSRGVRARFARPASPWRTRTAFSIGEEPRIAPVREAMQAKLAEAMGVEAERVTVRATTTDRLGFTGRGEGLAALAVALLE